jgi:hypothetical protein
VVDKFIKEKYLYWLEGLSLCKSIGKGVVSMAKLHSLVQVWHAQTTYLYCVLDVDADSARRQRVQTN